MSARQRRVDACDVVIVGAGVVGAAVAAQLAQQGMSAAILEAQGVAGGATGRSTGIVLTGLLRHERSKPFLVAPGHCFALRKIQNVLGITAPGADAEYAVNPRTDGLFNGRPAESGAASDQQRVDFHRLHGTNQELGVGGVGDREDDVYA